MTLTISFLSKKLYIFVCSIFQLLADKSTFHVIFEDNEEPRQPIEYTYTYIRQVVTYGELLLGSNTRCKIIICVI